MQYFNNLPPGSKNVLTFNFAAGLTGGNLLSGTPTVTVTVYSGTDPSPAAILNGSAQIDATNTQVLVPVAPTVNGVAYDITVLCGTNNPDIVLEFDGLLPVGTQPIQGYGSLITPGIVVFDPAAFIAAYPNFATVPAAALTNNFNAATLMLNNSLCSIVRDEPTRAMLLNLLTAHITALLNGEYGEGAAGAVGRVSSATEGSVSANIDYLTQSEASAYFTQTRWGAQFWQSTAIYRTARYVSPMCRDDWDAGWPE